MDSHFWINGDIISECRDEVVDYLYNVFEDNQKTNKKFHFDLVTISSNQIENLKKAQKLLEKLDIIVPIDNKGRFYVKDVLKYSNPIRYFILLVLRGSLFVEGKFNKLSDLKEIDGEIVNGGEYLQHISVYEYFLKNRKSIQRFDDLLELDMPAHSYFLGNYVHDLENNHFALK